MTQTVGTPQTVVPGEIELIRRFRGPIAEVLVLGAGFVVGLAVLSGAGALLLAAV